MLKELLQIEQNLKWHPEGNVWAHTVLVRKALEPALELWRMMCPNAPFAWLPSLDEEDIHIIKVGAWLHDIGKATPADGAYIQHDHPKVYTPYIEKLRENPFWRAVIDPIRGELDFIIQHHMKFSHKGLARRLQNRWLDEEGMFTSDKDVLRVFLVRMMDLIGRGSGTDVTAAHDFLLQLGQAAMKFRVDEPNSM